MLHANAIHMRITRHLALCAEGLLSLLFRHLKIVTWAESLCQIKSLEVFLLSDLVKGLAHKLAVMFNPVVLSGWQTISYEGIIETGSTESPELLLLFIYYFFEMRSLLQFDVNQITSSLH